MIRRHDARMKNYKQRLRNNAHTETYLPEDIVTEKQTIEKYKK